MQWSFGIMNPDKHCFVLIRGLFREKRHWGEFVHILQEQYPNADIFTLDIPGNGCFFQQTSPNTIAEYTDTLRQQLAGRNNLNLIALSMGGMIALDWMSRFPTEIKSAVLVNTSVRPHAPFFQRLRWQNYPAIFRMFFATPEQMEQQILYLTSNEHRENKVLLEKWQQWRKQKPISGASRLNQLLAAAKFSMHLKPLHPILIISAKNDQLVNYRCSLKLHQLWQIDYQQHDTAGHDLPLDDPQWLTQTIHRWLLTI